jgi:cytidylate kinase
MVIAIDGPGGVGKSTISRAVAEQLGIDHLDTGATYRAATLAVMAAGIDLVDTDAVVGVIDDAAIKYEAGRLLLNGQDVTAAARSSEVNDRVSAVSAIAQIRERIVDMQRDWVQDRGGTAVVEGRDIGTVVFPQARVKVFMTAHADVRAARRSQDAEAADIGVAQVKADLDRRDQIDSTRAASPLKPAEDAVVVDTSDMGVEEVVALVLDLVGAQRRSGRRPGPA